jgi:hypothetical protein
VKLPNNTKRAGGVAQGVDPEFEPQYHKEKNQPWRGGLGRKDSKGHTPLPVLPTLLSADPIPKLRQGGLLRVVRSPPRTEGCNQMEES